MPDKKPTWYNGDWKDSFEPVDPSKTFNTPFGKLSGDGKVVGDTDWPQFGRDAASDIVPSAVSMLTPEFQALSPLKNLLVKMGISFAGGTAADQAINIGQQKPLLNSAVDSGVNTGLGMLPELLNMGINLKGPQYTSTTTRGPSTSERTSSSTRNNFREGTSTREGSFNREGTSFSKGESSHTGTAETLGLSSTEAKSLGFQPSDVITKTIRIDPTTKKFVKAYQVQETVPREGQYQTNTDSTTNSKNNSVRAGTSSYLSNSGSQSQGNTTGNTTSSGTGGGTTQSTGSTVNIPGISQTTRNAPLPGMLGHVLEMLTNIESTKRLRVNGAPIVSPLQSALMGLGINVGTDATINRPQPQQ